MPVLMNLFLIETLKNLEKTKIIKHLKKIENNYSINYFDI